LSSGDREAVEPVSMTGDCMSMAEADGSAPAYGLAFVAGVDFDPSNPDEVEIVRLATQRDHADRVAAENRRLRDRHEVLLAAVREVAPELAEAFEDG